MSPVSSLVSSVRSLNPVAFYKKAHMQAVLIFTWQTVQDSLRIVASPNPTSIMYDSLRRGQTAAPAD